VTETKRGLAHLLAVIALSAKKPFSSPRIIAVIRRGKVNSIMEWAPWGGQSAERELTVGRAFERRKPMARHRTHSIEFKRQVAQEFLAGETLHGLAKRHDICRNLIRVWVQKYEAGDFDEDAQAADLLQQYEARIAALERLVGRQALELEFLKGAVKSAPRPKSATTSVIVGPRVSASEKDAG